MTFDLTFSSYSSFICFISECCFFINFLCSAISSSSIRVPRFDLLPKICNKRHGGVLVNSSPRVFHAKYILFLKEQKVDFRLFANILKKHKDVYLQDVLANHSGTKIYPIIWRVLMRPFVFTVQLESLLVIYLTLTGLSLSLATALSLWWKTSQTFSSHVTVEITYSIVMCTNYPTSHVDVFSRNLKILS